MPVSAWVMLFITLFIYLGGLFFSFSKIRIHKGDKSYGEF